MTYKDVRTFYSIELLRGLASIVILIVHYKHFYYAPDVTGLNGSLFSNSWVYLNLKFFVDYGANAVQLFWVISGFVFAHVYFQKKIFIKQYLTHRFSRLYPLHLLTLLLILLLQIYAINNVGSELIYQNNDLHHFVLNLFLISEWGLQDGRSFNGPIWSVSVELFSYFLFFLIQKLKQNSTLKLAFYITLSLIVYYLTRNMIFLCAFYFFVGCITYKISNKIANQSFFLAFCLFTISLIFLNIESKLPQAPINACLFASIIVLFVNFEIKFIKFRNIVSHEKILFIGKTSYGNYLLHSPIQIMILLLPNIKDFSHLIQGFLFFSGFLFFTLSVSFITFKYFEKPAQSYLNKLIIHEK